MGATAHIDNNRYPHQDHQLLGTKVKLKLKGKTHDAEIVRCDLPELGGAVFHELPISQDGHANPGAIVQGTKPEDYYKQEYDIIYLIRSPDGNVNRDVYVSMATLWHYPDFDFEADPSRIVGNQTEVIFHYDISMSKLARIVYDAGPLTVFLMNEGPHKGKLVKASECQYLHKSEVTVVEPRYVVSHQEYGLQIKSKGIRPNAKGTKPKTETGKAIGYLVIDSVKHKRVCVATTKAHALFIAGAYNKQEPKENQ